MSISIFIFLYDLRKNTCNLKFTCITFLTILLSIIFISKPSRKVYLVDYACFKPKKSHQISREETMKRTRKQVKTFTEESLQLLEKAIMTCGIGDFTYAPETLLEEPPNLSLEGARSEAEAGIYGAVDALLAKTGANPNDIGVLVVNCSLFNPVPSLSAMIVNRYKLRDNIKTYNLSGMGCSASIVAIDLANHLLQVHDNTHAMVVSIEVIGHNCYLGNDDHRMLDLNCMFRVGSAAILLSNKSSDRYTSKYQLIHTVRTNTSSSDTSYGCIFQKEDAKGVRGVTVTKDITVEARKAIQTHLITLGHLILPKTDRLMLGLIYIIKKLKLAKPKRYVPNFGRAIDHFFPHVGMKSVIDELERTLKLDVESPRMTLYRFGNTSSSAIWYELAYAEAKGRVRRGDHVWQLAFGSGFECNSVIWKAIRSVTQTLGTKRLISFRWNLTIPNHLL